MRLPLAVCLRHYCIHIAARKCSAELVHEAPAIGCSTLAGQLVVPLLLFEAVVVGQLLANANVLPRKEDQVGLPFHF